MNLRNAQGKATELEDLRNVTDKDREEFRMIVRLSSWKLGI